MTDRARFHNRRDAGDQLARRVAEVVGDRPVVVLGLTRGGVPVALEVARRLHAPLDVLIVRKLGVPYQPELAMGAVGEDGVLVVSENVRRQADVSENAFNRVVERERREIERRRCRLRGHRRPVEMAGRPVVVVDDGVATGATAQAACRVARARGAGPVILAAPVIADDTIARLGEDADEVVALVEATGSFSVGQWYEDFSATTDEEVIACLEAGLSTGGDSAEPS